MLVIKRVTGEEAESLCRTITMDLPEYFGLEESNEAYFKGVSSRVCYAAKIEGKYVGLISVDLPYPNNINLYWLGVIGRYQSRGVGARLVKEAERYGLEQGVTSMTVETLALENSNENYARTYAFYIKNGFMPLFNLRAEGAEWEMVYMIKELRV